MKKYNWFITTTVECLYKDKAATLTINSAVMTEASYLTSADLMKMKFAAEEGLESVFSKEDLNDVKVSNVTINNISYIGQCTEEEFHNLKSEKPSIDTKKLQ